MHSQLRGRVLAWKSTVIGVGRPGFSEGLGHSQAIRVQMCNRDSSEAAQKEQAYAQDHLPKDQRDLLQTDCREIAPNPHASSPKSSLQTLLIPEAFCVLDLGFLLSEWSAP